MSIVFHASDPGFWFGEHYIRIVRDFTTEAGTTEDIGFVATDLAKALDMRDAERVARLLDADQKGTHQVGTPGGVQTLTVISESGFYEVVVRSDKPQGKALRGLVVREILPTLRKTGSYQMQAAPAAPAIAGQSQDITASYLLMAGALREIGVQPGIAYAAAFDSIRKVTNLPVEDMRRSLPPAEREVPTLNATAVGELLGGISAKAANKRLIAAGLQFRTPAGHLQITGEGQKYGEAIPYARNGHAGYQILWLPTVIGVLAEQGDP